jgi:CRP-like cAMP-binding protein
MRDETQEEPEPTREDARAQLRRILKEVDIFRGLSDRHIDRVASLAKRTTVSEGEVLGQAGESGNSLFVIVDGEVQLSASSALGDITVRIAGRGQSWPLAGFVGTGTLVSSGKAMTDAELLVIPLSPMSDLCSQESQIGARVYRNVADLFVDRYGKTLARFASGAEKVVDSAEFLANM